MSGHTPLPWHIGWENTICHKASEWAEVPLASGWIEGAWVGDNATPESKANAELIVRACNCFYDIEAVLKDALLFVDYVALRARREGDEPQAAEAEDCAQRARAAIAKATQ